MIPVNNTLVASCSTESPPCRSRVARGAGTGIDASSLASESAFLLRPVGRACVATADGVDSLFATSPFFAMVLHMRLKHACRRHRPQTKVSTCTDLTSRTQQKHCNTMECIAEHVRRVGRYVVTALVICNLRRRPIQNQSTNFNRSNPALKTMSNLLHKNRFLTE
eukprot:m.604262 g.604262  ORF g.604262 m.604262 type:complete len:165 (-) comp22458_c0_seq2:132-626(-)